MKGKHRIIRTNRQRIALLNTSTLPDEKIVAALKALSREVDLDRVIVHMKNLGKHRRSLGRAYSYLPWETNTNGLRRSEWDYLITATNHGMKNSWVGTLAHEAKHIEQFREKLPRSERRAEHFAVVMAEKISTR